MLSCPSSNCSTNKLYNEPKRFYMYRPFFLCLSPFPTICFLYPFNNPLSLSLRLFFYLFLSINVSSLSLSRFVYFSSSLILLSVYIALCLSVLVCLSVHLSVPSHTELFSLFRTIFSVLSETSLLPVLIHILLVVCIHFQFELVYNRVVWLSLKLKSNTDI